MKNKQIILAITTIWLTINVCAAQKTSYRVSALKKGDITVVSQSNEAQIIRDFILYVPNAFTPNSDGLNETFGPVGAGVDQFSMLIFNRWGELIYESEDMNEQWDGTHQSKKVQADTYVYKIFATNNEKSVFKKAGKVSVII